MASSGGRQMREAIKPQFCSRACLGKHPCLECGNAGLIGRVWPMYEVVCEVIGELIAERPHQPAFRKVFGDKRRSAERHAAAGDGSLDDRRGIVDLQAPFTVDVCAAGASQPRTPRGKAALESHRSVMDQRMMLQVGSAAQGVGTLEQGGAAHRKEFIAQQERRLEPGPMTAAVADTDIDAIGGHIDKPSTRLKQQTKYGEL